MIRLTRGNILEAEAEAIVNTVNCVGVMGKGIALRFKKAFPDNFREYKNACNRKEVQPGGMFIYDSADMLGPRYIVNFPTKRHWKGKSRYEDVESGLVALVADVRRLGITSIAIPPLGCGLGGLDWARVRNMVMQAFDALPNVDVQLYEPAGAPKSAEQPIGTERPHLTVARCLFIKLIEQYASMAYRLTLLEIQKLAYFLQEAGQPLKLRYKAHIYGPYAHNLNMVLERLEGHYTRGYGDSQKPDVEIELIPGSAEEATGFLSNHVEEQERLERVGRLIEGFETPYGMELLASIHWLANHADQPAKTAADAVAGMQTWNARKASMFKERHITIAWERLSNEHWLEETPSPGHLSTESREE
jgi:O-acetyl-ADP-ribose deacetylase (regulator of RNase III)